VLLRGKKRDRELLLRTDASVPTRFQIRQRGVITTPIPYVTAHLAAIFIKHFPRTLAGVINPAGLPADIRRAILADVWSRKFRISRKIT
jgi:hypothetical protein